jgi:hypothetical protein
MILGELLFPPIQPKLWGGGKATFSSNPSLATFARNAYTNVGQISKLLLLLLLLLFSPLLVFLLMFLYDSHSQ